MIAAPKDLLKISGLAHSHEIETARERRTPIEWRAEIDIAAERLPAQEPCTDGYNQHSEHVGESYAKHPPS